ncbi:MAG: hypothetical protein RLZ12_259 [Bacillota bacterium]|jgi:hypothetical protein
MIGQHWWSIVSFFFFAIAVFLAATVTFICSFLLDKKISSAQPGAFGLQDTYPKRANKKFYFRFSLALGTYFMLFAFFRFGIYTPFYSSDTCWCCTPWFDPCPSDFVFNGALLLIPISFVLCCLVERVCIYNQTRVYTKGFVRHSLLPIVLFYISLVLCWSLIWSATLFIT